MSPRPIEAREPSFDDGAGTARNTNKTSPHTNGPIQRPEPLTPKPLTAEETAFIDYLVASLVRSIAREQQGGDR
jgi:hypothetical protein